ncbi:MAG: hypothetical protein Q9214_004259 [Letrouitia sp. 1 TL-2023]
MSGTNPFRRRDTSGLNDSQIYSTDTTSAEQQGRKVPPVNTDLPRTTKTKTVRIVSPHYSRSKDGGGIPGSISSPPPELNTSLQPIILSDVSSEESSSGDPFSAQSDEGDSTGEEGEDDIRYKSPAKPPLNQFANKVQLSPPADPSTLLAVSLSEGNSKATQASNVEDNQRSVNPGSSRPQYNVDEFKRLLLTGEKLKSDTNTPFIPHAYAQVVSPGDSNSNTDASSISRQSMFDPHHDSHQDSPRTSFELSPSDDEHHGLVQVSSPTRSRARPSVPASRHGKLVKQNVLQTIPFESLPSSAPLPRSDSDSSTKNRLSKSIDPITNIDKPLPPPPPPPPRSGSFKIEAPAEARANTSHQKGNQSKDLPRTMESNSESRSPPTPPLARRHSLLNSNATSTGSSQTNTLKEGSSAALGSPQILGRHHVGSKPALPPPRRTGLATDQSQQASAEGGKQTEAKTSDFSVSRPTMPPSRTSSNASLKRPARVSTIPSSPGIPPPPPRRRGSSQNSQGSFTPSRLSGEYRLSGIESYRSGPSSVTREDTATAIEPLSKDKDIIADISALQKEVDELRGKFGR